MSLRDAIQATRTPKRPAKRSTAPAVARVEKLRRNSSVAISPATPTNNSPTSSTPRAATGAAALLAAAQSERLPASVTPPEATVHPVRIPPLSIQIPQDLPHPVVTLEDVPLDSEDSPRGSSRGSPQSLPRRSPPRRSPPRDKDALAPPSPVVGPQKRASSSMVLRSSIRQLTSSHRAVSSGALRPRRGVAARQSAFDESDQSSPEGANDAVAMLRELRALSRLQPKDDDANPRTPLSQMGSSTLMPSRSPRLGSSKRLKHSPPLRSSPGVSPKFEASYTQQGLDASGLMLPPQRTASALSAGMRPQVSLGPSRAGSGGKLRRRDSVLSFGASSAESVEAENETEDHVARLVGAVTRTSSPVHNLQELIRADLALQGIGKQVSALFDDTTSPDVEIVCDALLDIEWTPDWVALQRHCPALQLIRSMPEDDAEIVLHDLMQRGIVYQAVSAESARIVRDSEKAKKLRQTDITWRRRCMDLEEELESSRKHFIEITRGTETLPPRRWVSAPVVAEVVGWVLFDEMPFAQAMQHLVDEWRSVSTILQDQISSTHSRVQIRLASTTRQNAGLEWKDLCYNDGDELHPEMCHSVADFEVIPIPTKPKPPKLEPMQEEARHIDAAEELPPKTYGLEDTRAADILIDEELPNPNRKPRGEAAKRWLRAGRSLRNMAMVWRSTRGINTEKSKAQSATAEPEVDFPGGSEKFKALWRDKRDPTTLRPWSVLDELVANIHVPRVCDTPEFKLLALAQAVHTMYHTKHEVAPKSVSGRHRNRIEVFVMALYTMAGADVDRAMLFPAVPDSDDDFSQYAIQFPHRNSAPFREMNSCMRTAVIKVDETREAVVKDSDKAWIGVDKWVKTMGLLYSLCHDTYSDQVLSAEGGMVAQCPAYFRGLAGLHDDVTTMHDNLKPGSILHWPAPSSCAKDEDVATRYVNGEATNAFKSKGGTVFYYVKGVRRGLPLREMSQYPQEAEVLVAPFTTFRVDKPLRIPGLKSSRTRISVLEWVNTDPLGQGFTDACFAESKRISKLLEELAMSGCVILRQSQEELGIAFSSNMAVMEIKPGSPAEHADAKRFMYVCHACVPLHRVLPHRGRRLVDCNGVRVDSARDLRAATSVSEVVVLQFSPLTVFDDATKAEALVDTYGQPTLVYAKAGSVSKPTAKERQEAIAAKQMQMSASGSAPPTPRQGDAAA